MESKQDKAGRRAPTASCGVSTHSAVNVRVASGQLVSSKLQQQLGDSKLGVVASNGVSDPVGNELNRSNEVSSIVNIIKENVESELFKQNPWWEQSFSENSIPRKQYVDKIFENIDDRQIIFLTGLRRIGKTTIMRQVISKLLSAGIPASNIFFVNLDSFALRTFSIHDLMEKYRELHKKSSDAKFYFFIDEVATKEGFETELKSIYDLENAKVICSSSMATMMRDKRAALTGRTKTIEVMPLTFSEFLVFKNAQVKKSDRAKLEGLFRDYLYLGGIPYYVLTEDKEYINELVESIIYKDIIAHHKIKNEKVILEMFALLCMRVGKPTSYSKLHKLLNISVDSVKQYIGYFEKAYLFYSIGRCTKSYNEKIISPKKIYVGDVAIKNLITGNKDFGASYENLVFLTIKNEKPEYYNENGIELDFITEDTFIEAKYGSQMNAKQGEAFKSINRKKKLVADGVRFFMEE